MHKAPAALHRPQPAPLQPLHKFLTSVETVSTSGAVAGASVASGEQSLRYCDCSQDLYDCSDFQSQDDAQACYWNCGAQNAGDVHQLDLDVNRIACDNLSVTQASQQAAPPAPIPPTSLPPTTIPTAVPPTPVPPTPVPPMVIPTVAPSTPVPPTAIPTAVPPTSVPPTLIPTVPEPFVPQFIAEGEFCSICTANVYNCESFPTQDDANRCLSYCWEIAGEDVHDIDRDDDMDACEPYFRDLETSDEATDAVVSVTQVEPTPVLPTPVPPTPIPPTSVPTAVPPTPVPPTSVPTAVPPTPVPPMPTPIPVMPTATPFVLQYVEAGTICSVCTEDAYNCVSFASQTDAQQCLNSCRSVTASKDIHGLDENQNDYACEAHFGYDPFNILPEQQAVFTSIGCLVCDTNEYNCSNFAAQSDAQACMVYCEVSGFGDIHGLDGNDNDGLACESLP